MRKVSPLTLPLAAFALVPGSIAAQEEPNNCGIWNECGTYDDEHTFTSHVGVDKPDAQGTGTYHEWCGRCWVDGELEDPWECHPTCLENEEDEEDYEALIEAADRLDEAKLLRATIDSPQLAVLNLERGSVQLLGCEDRILANIPIDRATIQEFQEAFAPLL